MASFLLVFLVAAAGCGRGGARAETEAREALAAARAGELGAAHQAFGRALALDPDNLVALYNGGIAALALGRGDEAVARFERFATLRPDDALGRFHLGRAYAREGRRDEAIGALRSSVERGFADLAQWRLAPELEALANDLRLVQLEAVVAQRAGDGVEEAPRPGEGYAGRPIPDAILPGTSLGFDPSACEP
ncbi:tetratricopeptide repeat protein [Vulgatibacter incomptus]|uniref:tetratricopeptide repeat protein n=1 Tax=Vulgatibacter incomptus TaxID=1391653 RepID=UPI0012F9FBCF|nr:tetratricopeptide repeat protein [Vulgatibacter incomptus]